MFPYHALLGKIEKLNTLNRNFNVLTGLARL